MQLSKSTISTTWPDYPHKKEFDWANNSKNISLRNQLFKGYGIFLLVVVSGVMKRLRQASPTGTFSFKLMGSWLTFSVIPSPRDHQVASFKLLPITLLKSKSMSLKLFSSTLMPFPTSCFRTGFRVCVGLMTSSLVIHVVGVFQRPIGAGRHNLFHNLQECVSHVHFGCE
jgi:hypothetical protein